jgi:hypothetical protein
MQQDGQIVPKLENVDESTSPSRSRPLEIREEEFNLDEDVPRPRKRPPKPSTNNRRIKLPNLFEQHGPTLLDVIDQEPRRVVFVRGPRFSTSFDGGELNVTPCVDVVDDSEEEESVHESSTAVEHGEGQVKQSSSVPREEVEVEGVLDLRVDVCS